MCSNERMILRSEGGNITKDLEIRIEDPLGLGVIKMQEHILNELLSKSPSRFKWGYSDKSQDQIENDEDEFEEEIEGEY